MPKKEDRELEELIRHAYKESQRMPMTPERLRRIVELRKETLGSTDFAREAAAKINRMTDEEVTAEIAKYDSSDENLQDKLDAWERKARRNRMAGLLAAAIVICVGLGIVLATFAQGPAEAGKDDAKYQDQAGKTTVIREGAYADPQTLVETERETDWEKVPELKTFLPQLCIPGYIPEGYAFKELVVKKSRQNNYSAEYQFANAEGDALCINQVGVADSRAKAEFLENVTEEIDAAGETIYKMTPTAQGELAIAAVFRGEVRIDVASGLDDGELVQIFQGFSQ